MSDKKDDERSAETPKPPKPKAKPKVDGVRRQRQHIKELTGEDPLRGGVAD